MSPSDNLPDDAKARGVAPTDLSPTRRSIRLFAIAIVLMLVVGFLVVHFIKARHADDIRTATNDARSSPPLVETTAAQDSAAALSLKLPGETAAWYDSVIYGRVDGYVASWSANIGDAVHKGQVLATIDTPDLDAQLAAVQAKLKAADAGVEFARTTYKRWSGSPPGVVSDQERESKKADYDSALAQVALDQADIDRYTALTAFKKVTAPYDGTITERRIDIGNLITAGSTSSTTPVYRIVQDDPIRIFVDVPQDAAQDIKPGLEADVTASNIPGHVFAGKVARTADALNEQTRTLRAEVDLPNPDHHLVSGMYVDVAFQVSGAGLVQVPSAAMVFRSGGPQIAVVGNDNKVEFRSVVIARDNGGTLEIASGVKAGDRVALNIGSQVTAGETVAVQDVSDSGQPHAE